MNLTQLKQDRERGVLISQCTWDALLAYAISLEPTPDAATIHNLEWVSVEDRLPPKGESVLIFYPLDPAEPYRIDMWDEWHEDPIGMGGATVCVGEGWMSFNDDPVSHWMSLPAAPLSYSAAIGKPDGEGS